MFRSLRHRNLRLFLLGQIFSLIGTWLQIIAGTWLIYRLTGSAVLLGVFAFLLNFPSFIISPLAGLAADRYDRRSLLVLINVLLMAQAFVLWGLVITGLVEVWHVMALTLVQGMLNAGEMTVRQSFLVRLIDDQRDLPNAVALNSSVFNGSRLVGPALAGLAISALGEGICFLLNAASFLPVIMLLSLMRFSGRHARVQAAGGGFREGVKYAHGSMPLRLLLAMVAVLSMASGAFHSLAPVFATQVLSGGPRTLGYLLAWSGGGAFLGAVYLASRKSVLGLGRVVAVTGLATGTAYMFFALQDIFWAAAAASFVSGLFIITTIAGMNVIIQTLVDEHMRGRVMSLYSVALVGMSPFGSLAAGWTATRWDVMTAMFWTGVMVFAAMGYFWLRLPQFRLHVRPVYARKGIIPEMQ